MLQTELKTQLKTGKIGGVYLFCGEEEYLKRHYLNEIRKQILTDPVFDAFNHRCWIIAFIRYSKLWNVAVLWRRRGSST